MASIGRNSISASEQSPLQQAGRQRLPLSPDSWGFCSTWSSEKLPGFYSVDHWTADSENPSMSYRETTQPGLELLSTTSRR